MEDRIVAEPSFCDFVTSRVPSFESKLLKAVCSSQEIAASSWSKGGRKGTFGSVGLCPEN